MSWRRHGSITGPGQLWYKVVDLFTKNPLFHLMLKPNSSSVFFSPIFLSILNNWNHLIIYRHIHTASDTNNTRSITILYLICYNKMILVDGLTKFGFCTSNKLYFGSTSGFVKTYVRVFVFSDYAAKYL